MTEYIDKVQAISIIAEGKNHKAYFGTTNKDWEVIDFLKTVSHADVVEREKINEALDRAYEMRNKVLYANDCYEPNDVLDIIDQITKLFEELQEDKDEE